MNIGKNFLSFNLFSSLNRNLSEGILPQAASINNVLRVASSNSVNSVIKDKYIDEYIDEYIPSATSSVTTKNKIEINKT
ncbi:MAG: hypothetical protein LBK82_17415, partial [Planctomycetaceae bacterium]|nr:hypothetical protein [Planctomycetaceae bacterium]